jgi:hypothetical protein
MGTWYGALPQVHGCPCNCKRRAKVLGGRGIRSANHWAMSLGRCTRSDDPRARRPAGAGRCCLGPGDGRGADSVRTANRRGRCSLPCVVPSCMARCRVPPGDRDGDVTFMIEWTERGDPRSVAMASEIARMVGVEASASERVRFDFGRPFGHFLGLSLRREEARKRVFTALWGLVRREWAKAGDVLEIDADARFVEDLVDRCAFALLEPATRPLTPRLVLAALPITKQERVRWTKDGRLAQSGAVTMKRAQLISVPTYAVDTIAALVASPEILSRWRAEDTADRLRAATKAGQATG